MRADITALAVLWFSGICVGIGLGIEWMKARFRKAQKKPD
jgi:hypothetical protein